VTETLALLLLAHALADFVLQPRRMAMGKRDPLQLLLHGAIVLITAQLSLGQFAALPLLALAAAHVVIDALKARLLAPSLTVYLTDQAAHLATLVATALFFPDLFSTGIWSALPWLPAAAAIVGGAIIATLAGAQVVGFLLAGHSKGDLPPGLADAGRTIGLLERGLIFIFVFVEQPEAIGFLIALKAIMQFDPDPQRFEIRQYVIIGTLASFGWALLAAYATLALLAALPPLGILPPPS
jgi:hypothetical protein